MLVVGLTGGIASGKSTVSDMFKEAGIPVVCADELAHEAVKAGSPALEEIRRCFGEEVISPNGELDRAVMARLVFGDQSKRELLESIIHPKVAEEKDKLLTRLERQGHRLAVVDVPLLYETGWERFFDLVVVVYVPERLQVERLVARDNMSEEDARARLLAQMPIEEKKSRADHVVDNAGSLERTREQVEGILRRLRVLEEKRAQA